MTSAGRWPDDRRFPQPRLPADARLGGHAGHGGRGAADHHGHPPAALHARPAPVVLHHDLHRDPPGGPLHPEPPRLLRLPVDPADRHPAAPGPQRGLHAPDPAARRQGGRLGRQGHPVVRQLRGGGQLRRRPGGLLHPGGHQLHRDHQGYPSFSEWICHYIL